MLKVTAPRGKTAMVVFPWCLPLRQYGSADQISPEAPILTQIRSVTGVDRDTAVLGKQTNPQIPFKIGRLLAGEEKRGLGQE